MQELKKSLPLFTPIVLLTFPYRVSAATFKELVNGPVVAIGNGIVALLYALAFIIFIAGIFRFFFVEGDEGREKGKQLMVWGIFGLVILFSVWGIVKLLLGSLQSV